jgi:hypothetical protein
MTTPRSLPRSLRALRRCRFLDDRFRLRMQPHHLVRLRCWGSQHSVRRFTLRTTLFTRIQHLPFPDLY